jgi:hypothetical protein
MLISYSGSERGVVVRRDDGRETASGAPMA